MCNRRAVWYIWLDDESPIDGVAVCTEHLEPFHTPGAEVFKLPDCSQSICQAKTSDSEQGKINLTEVKPLRWWENIIKPGAD